MSSNTKIFNKFKGYTTEDCACHLCPYYPGKRMPCPLVECCCAEERRLAREREGTPGIIWASEKCAA